jgi:hypothetical protein
MGTLIGHPGVSVAATSAKAPDQEYLSSEVYINWREKVLATFQT